MTEGKEPRLETLQTLVQRTSTRTYDFLAKERLDTSQIFILEARRGSETKGGAMFTWQTDETKGD